MASTNIRLAVEKELEFYARFPEEISLFYNDDLENGIYFKMPKKEFDNLVSEIGKIIYAADHQVKEIIDAFVSEVKRKDLIKIDPMKNQQRLWRCRIKCVPKESGDSISNIWIG
jgi:hypothetical protein